MKPVLNLRIGVRIRSDTLRKTCARSIGGIGLDSFRLAPRLREEPNHGVRQGGFMEMPRYFFHVRRGRLTILDRVGVELADVGEAAREAARRGREIAAYDAQKGAPPGAGMIIIEDEWRTILELPFEDINDG